MEFGHEKAPGFEAGARGWNRGCRSATGRWPVGAEPDVGFGVDGEDGKAVPVQAVERLGGLNEAERAGDRLGLGMFGLTEVEALGLVVDGEGVVRLCESGQERGVGCWHKGIGWHVDDPELRRAEDPLALKPVGADRAVHRWLRFVNRRVPTCHSFDLGTRWPDRYSVIHQQEVFGWREVLSVV